MSFGDRFRRVMGIPEPPDPAAARKQGFREAAARGDEAACLEQALALLTAQHFDDALWAFHELETLFPARKAEWLRWQGQLLYIHLAFRAETDAERVGCYERALACYFEAAALGDRSQEFNVVELCEQLAAERGVPLERKQSAYARYLALFTQGEGRRRVEALAR